MCTTIFLAVTASEKPVSHISAALPGRTPQLGPMSELLIVGQAHGQDEFDATSSPLAKPRPYFPTARLYGSSPQGGVVCQSISVLRGSDKKLEAGKQSQMLHTYRNFSCGDQTILANLPSAMYICETVRHTSSWHWQGEKLVIVRYSTTELVLEMIHSPPHTPSRLERHIRSRGRAPQPTHIQTTLISPAPPTRTAIRHPCPVPGAPTPACDCECIRPRVPGLGSREARCGNAAATSRLRLQLVALGPYAP